MDTEEGRPESTNLVDAHDLLPDLDTCVMCMYELQLLETRQVSDECEGSCRPHLPVSCWRLVDRRAEQARHELERGARVNDPPSSVVLKVRNAVVHLERLRSG